MSLKTRFEELALPLQNSAYNLAYWIVRNRDDAEDVVQNAYLRAYRAFGGFKGDAMRPWFLTIVRNSAFQVLQERKRAGNVIPFDSVVSLSDSDEWSELTTQDVSAEDKLIADVEARQLRKALAELPLAYRDVVVLRELEGLAYTEVATVLGIPIGTVMSRLSRGRALLRKGVLRLEAKDRSDAM